MLSGECSSRPRGVTIFALVVLGLTLLPISSAFAAAPDRMFWSQAGWRVMAMASDAGAFVGCYAERTYFRTSNPNATWRVQFANYYGNRWVGIIGGTNTHIVANRRLNLVVDGQVVLAVTPSLIDADNARLGAISEETIAAISAGNVMEIVTVSGRHPLALDGSTPALAKVAECVAAGIAAEVATALRLERQAAVVAILPATATTTQDFSNLLAWNAGEAKPLPVRSSTAVQRPTETQRVPVAAPNAPIVSGPAALLVGIRDALAPASGAAVVTPIIDRAMIAHQAKVDELNSPGGSDGHWYDNVAAIVAVLVYIGVLMALAVIATAIRKTRTMTTGIPLALITTDLVPLRPNEGGAEQASSDTAAAPQPKATSNGMLRFGKFMLGLLAFVGVVALKGTGRAIAQSLGWRVCLGVIGIILAIYLLTVSTKQLRGYLRKSLAVSSIESRLWWGFSLLWIGSALLVIWAFQPLGRYWLVDFWWRGTWLKFFLILVGPLIVSFLGNGLYKWANQRPVVV